ncbi:MAG: hypothetical protein RRC07_08360, partial [Anaerolineae bacterium]|nr:hypothetical protein [Anaerolineae bacterium]
QPTAVSTLEVDFPGCSSGPCFYAGVTFKLWRPQSVGQVAFNSYDPSSGSPAVQVRRSPDLFTDPTRVTISGANIHPFSPIYLYKVDYRCATRPPLEDCEKHLATIHGYSADFSEVIVSVPGTIDYGSYFFGMHDTWARPSNGPLAPSSYRYGPDFPMGPPDYPYLWGLGFENIDDEVTVDEFLGVDGKNAYFCPGFWEGDVCFAITPIPIPVTPHPEPRYFAVWFGLYAIWIGTGNGSCNGMAATSQLFHDGAINTTDLSPAVYYPAGFTSAGRPADYIYTTPFGPLGAPPHPVDLWSHVRINHGVQVSPQFMAPAIDTVFRGPSAVTDAIRSDPTNYVLCLRNGGAGHCVSPFRVRDLPGGDSAIDIYDNNYPNAVRTITIDRSDDDFHFLRSDSDTWIGDWLAAVPLSVWQNGRTAFDDLRNIAATYVFGAADVLYDNGEGEWGWKDGAVVETMPGGVAMPHFEQSETWEPHAPILFLPSDKPAPAAAINSLGGDYNFFSAGDGIILNLFAGDIPAGDEDSVQLGKNGAGAIDAFTYTPESAREHLVPRVAMELGEGSSTVFSWQGLSLPAGGGCAPQDLDGDGFRETCINFSAIASHHVHLPAILGR